MQSNPTSPVVRHRVLICQVCQYVLSFPLTRADTSYNAGKGQKTYHPWMFIIQLYETWRNKYGFLGLPKQHM